MNTLFVIASFVALAVASPAYRGLVAPGGAGPIPAPEFEPIAVGPAILEFEPIAVGPALLPTHPISVGPALVDTEPVAVGPAIVEPVPVMPVQVVDEAENVAASNPLVQIILNINGVSHVIDTPISIPTPVIVPEPVAVVEAAPEPVQVVEAAPEPVQVIESAPAVIGTPELPTPVV
ncbi:hypothetical protein CDL29_25015, partial [Escherichia coli]